ncbi:NAD(P)-dependent oxidoreductase [Streptomyces roseirectus]|uniref:NAD(P)-dependent oxidoreductase n=1 Tax=Streptomyces roseirectus TaxID=2768066 RepID=A0A7H0IPW2_9ACTN|nr:NAD(P)-dependent oxidoreductase [Streptomyces roseirectus]QNP74828.1 NAD(P)-dependent oxidoreductase [Streptomyces roseirectus]
MARQRLSAVVMTHPRRREAAEKLALSAPDGLLRVVMDPDPTGTPSVLRTALAAWSAVEDGATHQLVIQDDMVLSESFYERVRSAIEARPDAALALFALWDSRNGAAVRMGALAGARWAGAVNEYFPCVAIVLPRAHAEGFAAYGRTRLGGWPDDILMHRYLRDHGVPRYVAIPNLTEHEDRGSISGNAFRGPRRSVCFLPDDLPGDEARTLTGLTVLPFFKHGVAQCAVRVPGPGPEHWLHLDTEQYLEGAGLPRALLRPPGSGPAEPDVRGTWLTALAMGYEAARIGLMAPPSASGAYAEALATIGPGGISNTATEEHIARRREPLVEVARRALDAGREVAGRRPRPHPRRPGGLVWRGADTPLGEHLARRLADLHEPSDAVIDLTPLRSAAPSLTIRPHGSPTPYTLNVGEVYGPGCSHLTPIGRLVWDALRSHPLTVEGDPDSEVHAVHVHDLADAIAAVLHTRPDTHTLTAGPGKPSTAADLARSVHDAVRPVPILTAPRSHPGWHTPPDHPRPPGWTPSTGLARGLHAFAQWLAYEGILLAPN